MILRRFLMVLPLLALISCEKDDPRYQAEDERNPHFEEAQKAIHDRDFEKAVKSYEAALRKNPKAAAAHYEIGMLYSERLGDPVKAIYHLQRFLDERPNTDKSEMARGHLENSKITFAATLPNSPVQNAELFAKIQSENLSIKKEREDLYKKITELEGALASEKELHAKALTQFEEEKVRLTKSIEEAQKNAAIATTAANAPQVNPIIPATSTATPASTANANTQAQSALGAVKPVQSPTEPASQMAPQGAGTAVAPGITAGTESRNYTIAKGDTLWKISKKFYPKDVVNGIDRIKKANSEALPENKPLKIGTVIVIP